jgi:ABC-type polysaccharide/polyol phosphate export permease
MGASMWNKWKAALADVCRAREFASLVHLLGWQDMRHRYRRSLLGPFWLVGSTAALVASICLVMGPMFRVPASEYVPYVAAGMMVWHLIVSMAAESCQAFISQAAMIRQSSAPLFTYVARVAWRNTLLFAHSLIIFPVALWVAGAHTNANALLALPGFLLLMANLGWLALVLGILAARYRDLPKTIDSIVPVMMFLTPVMWMPEMAPSRLGARLAAANPFYWLIELVRGPLTGGVPPAALWVAAGLASVAGWLGALALFARTRERIVYWL